MASTSSRSASRKKRKLKSITPIDCDIDDDDDDDDFVFKPKRRKTKLVPTKSKTKAKTKKERKETNAKDTKHKSSRSKDKSKSSKSKSKDKSKKVSSTQPPKEKLKYRHRSLLSYYNTSTATSSTSTADNNKDKTKKYKRLRKKKDSKSSRKATASDTELDDIREDWSPNKRKSKSKSKSKANSNTNGSSNGHIDFIDSDGDDIDDFPISPPKRDTSFKQEADSTDDFGSQMSQSLSQSSISPKSNNSASPVSMSSGGFTPPTHSQAIFVDLTDEDDDILTISNTNNSEATTVNKFSVPWINKTTSKAKPNSTQAKKNLKSKKSQPTKATKRKTTSKQRGPHESKSDSDLWIEKYAPTSLDELAVTTKKVNEVVSWLKTNMHNHAPNAQKLLCLKGGAGAGKSALIKLACEYLQYNITEWNESPLCTWQDVNGNLTGGYQSRLSEFSKFISATQKYSALLHGEEQESILENRVILLDEIPYLHNKEQVEQFRDAIRNFLYSNSQSLMVLLLTTVNGPVNRSSQTSIDLPRGVYSLLSTDILTSRLTHVVPILPVGSRATLKVLKQIAAYEQITMPNEVASLIEDSRGDLRSAINNFQMFCRTKLQHKQEMKLLSRDPNYSIFHATGKILYNKRESITLAEAKKHKNNSLFRAPSPYNPELLWEQMNSSNRNFGSFLHEYYIEMFTKLDDIATASAYLSAADALSLDSNSLYKYADTIEKYKGSVITRGLLFSNTETAKQKAIKQFCKPQMSTVYKIKRNFVEDISFYFNDELPANNNNNNAGNKAIFKPPSAKTTHSTLNAPLRQLCTEVLPLVSTIATYKSGSVSLAQTKFVNQLCNMKSTKGLYKTQLGRQDFGDVISYPSRQPIRNDRIIELQRLAKSTDMYQQQQVLAEDDIEDF